MPQSLAKILVHTVFSTKERGPLLRDQALREELHRYLGGILTNLDCQPIIVGGFEDHVRANPFRVEKTSGPGYPG
jgi:putative transposase